MTRRFIPACAGNARHTSCPCVALSVHPRMRGERARAPVAYMAKYGSSPHARGTRGQHGYCSATDRFIPACAGNAPNVIVTSVVEVVHPRMRGERRAERGRTAGLGGSSPHARGTPHPSLCSPSDRRFIPACAGNASHPTTRTQTASVHPRMRGERWRAVVEEVVFGGSSPHARGTHFQ